MTLRRNSELGRQAVVWLATAFVILIGAAACAFIILASVEQPSQPFLVWGATFGGLVAVFGFLAMPGDKRQGNGWLRLWLASKRTAPHVVRIGRKKAAPTQFGNNAPPTLESVREASEQNVTWVPRSLPPNRSGRR